VSATRWARRSSIVYCPASLRSSPNLFSFALHSLRRDKAIGSSAMERRRRCQLFSAFERPITITRLPNRHVHGLASFNTVVEPSRKRTVIS
jgi:hypothetical protein